MSALRRQLPNAVTFLGHALSLWWLLGGAWWLAVAGLLCDSLDGQIARRLGLTSTFGSLYDWTVDVTIAAIVVCRLGAPWLLAPLLPLQVLLRHRGVQVSGRAGLTIALVLS